MSLSYLLREVPTLACMRQCVRHKHYALKFRHLRKLKVMKVNLPDFDKARKDSKLSPEEFTSMMKKEGIKPPRDFQERQLLISCTGNIFEPYVPPEGDGVASRLSVKGASQKIKELEMKGKSMNQLRKIRPYEDDFEINVFPEIALNIYKESFELLQNVEKNQQRLHELFTEKAYPELTWKLNKKTFRWSFVESMEAPRCVHVRTQEMMSKDNIFGQVTVRFHSKMLLSIYDRFGRLAFGSEQHPFELVEYVVFEKHLSNEYGMWRIHGKVVPEWSSKSDNLEFAVLRTTVKPKTEAIDKKDVPKDIQNVDQEADNAPAA